MPFKPLLCSIGSIERVSFPALRSFFVLYLMTFLAFIILLLLPAVHISRPHKQLIHLRLSLFISVFTITNFSLRIITRHISLDEVLARFLFFYILCVSLRLEMRDTASPLLPSNINKRVAAHQDGRRQYFDRLCIAEQRAVAEQNSPNLLSQKAEDEIILPGSSDDIRYGAISMKPPSPCTVYSRTRNAAAHTHPPSPPSNISSGGFSPVLQTMSPEEHSLMTNSANFARGRRRRGAIQHDILLEPELSSSFLSAPPSPYALPRDLDSSDDDNARSSEVFSVNDDNRATPRGRLQRSFTPSERDDSGVVLVPGLLRRLGRPFSGPWRGLSSPLAPVSLVAAPPAGRMARLRRLFSRCY
ncbi:hypothetical protein KCU77_g7137, partial [Aureobasidium melanogenum]